MAGLTFLSPGASPPTTAPSGGARVGRPAVSERGRVLAAHAGAIGAAPWLARQGCGTLGARGVICTAAAASSFATCVFGRSARQRRARARARGRALRATAAEEASRPPLRFQVGERVECLMDTWEAGTVVKHWYKEPTMPDSVAAPYQVKLDCGMTIFAPYDMEECIRRASGLARFGKIPVTVLTGFLGAGKTTLLNYILTKQHGKKYAIIENEFGDVAIDEMLVDQAAGKQTTMESITVVDNGCLCCTMRGDLVKAIKDIVSTVQARLESGIEDAMIDGILIETTGMADPGPICKTFGLDADVNQTCKIDGVVTVVDSVHFLEQLSRERSEGAVNESAQQVAFADKVLLNKVDAVSPEKLMETTAAIRGINQIAKIVECSLVKRPDELPISELVELDAFDTSKLLTEEGERSANLFGAATEEEKDGHADDAHAHSSDSACQEPDCKDPTHKTCKSKKKKQDGACKSSACTDDSQGHGDSHGHEHSHGESQAFRHDTDIGTILLELKDAPLSLAKFQCFIDTLLVERSVDLYRYKGILAVRQDYHVARYVLQGVHDMMEITYSGEWPEGSPLKTQIVVIGRKLDKEEWSRRFEECASPVPVQPVVV